MMKPIITALCSFGMSGEVFHAPFIANNDKFELKYILERTKDNSKVKYPLATIERDYNTIISNPEIDLVIVNTPSQLHYDMTKTALEAGKHVVVEKPFTVKKKEGMELINLAQDQNLILAVFHNKRLEGEFKTVQKILNENLLGDILSFQSQFDRYRPEIGPKKWKEYDTLGAGILYDLGSHLIDQILILFGKPLAVYADLQIQREYGQVIDYFKVDFYYNRFVATAKAGMLVKDIGPKYEIKGTKGNYIKYGVDPQEELLKQGKLPNQEKWGEEMESSYGYIVNNIHEKRIIPTLHGTYMDFYDGVYESIRNNKPFIIKPLEALNVIEMIEIAEESNRKNEKIIL